MAATVRTWLCNRIDDGVARQIEQVSHQPDVCHVAVMPDVHMGRVIPNGIAVATRRLVYPDLVGADIGCGLAAIGFDGLADDVPAADRDAVLERLLDAVPTLKHRPDRAALHRDAVGRLGALSSPRLTSLAAREGAYQLGTLGRGNHFFELASDEQGQLWAVVHTGSRAMGQAITAHHITCAARPVGYDGGASDGDLSWLAIDTPAGSAYLADMEWACRYAAANRAAILNAAADILECLFGMVVDVQSFVDSPHNTATLEHLWGKPAIVHRKSANHASEGRCGIVAGSMAVGTRIVIGLGNADALESSAHGAGRVMSRGEAMERLGSRDIEGRMGRITYRRTWANQFRDEAPSAYRELHEVMRAQRDLVKSERMLTPILNDKRV
jgi:tRNA-splicing ligase RtcB (3'-phosphate/5'-hydroxy nucleic acid ligase)